MKYVYLVERNSDMTEGKGPMINDSVFGNYEDAEKYVLSQTGVMGREVHIKEYQSELSDTVYFTDWNITEFIVKEK